MTLGADRPSRFPQDHAQSEQALAHASTAQVRGGETTLAGSGRHVDYGPFTIAATLSGDGPHADLVFANPLPAAGLKDVHVALAPTDDGFAHRHRGPVAARTVQGRACGSMRQQARRSRSQSTRFNVSDTDVTGKLAIADGTATAHFSWRMAGSTARLRLSPKGGAQGFTIALKARDASFGGATPLSHSPRRYRGIGVVRRRYQRDGHRRGPGARIELWPAVHRPSCRAGQCRRRGRKLRRIADRAARQQLQVATRGQCYRATSLGRGQGQLRCAGYCHAAAGGPAKTARRRVGTAPDPAQLWRWRGDCRGAFRRGNSAFGQAEPVEDATCADRRCRRRCRAWRDDFGHRRLCRQHQRRTDWRGARDGKGAYTFGTVAEFAADRPGARRQAFAQPGTGAGSVAGRWRGQGPLAGQDCHAARWRLAVRPAGGWQSARPAALRRPGGFAMAADRARHTRHQRADPHRGRRSRVIA